MGSFLRPRRGLREDAINSNLKLKRGELFLEFPKDNTALGFGQGRIMVGNNESVYKDLYPFLSTYSEDIVVTFFEKDEYGTTHDIEDKSLNNDEETEMLFEKAGKETYQIYKDGASFDKILLCIKKIITSHKNRIDRLEKENKELKERLSVVENR